MTGPVLVLGGTAEARALAQSLVGAGRPVISSLAGRVQNPALPVGEVRIGGFSTEDLDGVAGLSRYLQDRRISALVDATHPYATRISAHAAVAATRTGVRLLRLERPGWADHPDAGRWTWVDSIAEAVTTGAGARRPLLTTGRQSLAAFLPWSGKDVTVRVVDPPDVELPARWRLIRSRGPYDASSERTLFTRSGTDLLVTKDSGGRHTVAKLEVAGELDVPVLVIARPPRPADAQAFAEVGELLVALDET